MPQSPFYTAFGVREPEKGRQGVASEIRRRAAHALRVGFLKVYNRAYADAISQRGAKIGVDNLGFQVDSDEELIDQLHRAPLPDCAHMMDGSTHRA